MVFASLRFDDAIHVRPCELVMQEEGLFGVAWQTKVDRKRVGTKFAVPAVGFRSSSTQGGAYWRRLISIVITGSQS